MLADHRNSDGVQRQRYSSPLSELISEPGFYETDTALAGYYDTPRPANDNTKVYRSVKSALPRHCYNSSSWKYTDVALPRVSILDGDYVANDNAANDNAALATVAA
jgi:hypothetical protein